MPDLQLTPLNSKMNWDDFVLNHPQGSLFHLTSWKRVIEKTFGHKSEYVAAVEGDDIRGIFPVFEIRSRVFGHYWVSVPFGETGGPLSRTHEADALFYDHARKLLASSGAGYFEFRHRNPLPGLVTKDLYYTFSRSISQDAEDNLNAIPRKSRAMVRKGIKNGLRSETGAHLLPEFYDLLTRNFHRLGTPAFTKKLFANFLESFGDMCDLLVVYTPENCPAAGVMFFTFKGRMIPYYAGSDFRYRQLAPNDFMYWELMGMAAEKGLNTFDFGRSKIGTGSFDFKRHWGFEPVPLSYQYMLAEGQEMPNLSPANPRYRRKIELWRKMPLGLTRMIGPFISKYLA